MALAPPQLWTAQLQLTNKASIYLTDFSASQ